MTLSIRHPDADRLARELAARTGETLTEAVIVALRERLARVQGRTRARHLRDELAAIRERVSTLPALDRRTTDEIVGYDEGASRSDCGLVAEFANEPEAVALRQPSRRAPRD